MSGNILVQNSAGYLLRATTDGITCSSLADDDCMWTMDGDELQAATTPVTLVATPKGGDVYLLEQKPISDHTDNRSSELSGPHKILAGPARSPSTYLAELRQQGFTVLENIIAPDAIERLKSDIAQIRTQHHSAETDCDGHFWIMDGLSWSPELASAASHPVALWVLQQYMGTNHIHYCHQPIITTLKPARALLNTFPEGGWHSDYPYHPGVFPDELWPPERPFGVQFNVCVDPFTAETGATQFEPGSHRLGRFPPAQFNQGGTRVGEGLHRNVRQMTAPAGAALLYDARTWHRACHELNVSGRDRIALLNAVAPAWVLPMIDKDPVAQKYLESNVRNLLSDREAGDIQRLCQTEVIPPPDDAPALQQRRLPRKQ